MSHLEGSRPTPAGIEETVAKQGYAFTRMVVNGEAPDRLQRGRLVVLSTGIIGTMQSRSGVVQDVEGILVYDQKRVEMRQFDLGDQHSPRARTEAMMHYLSEGWRIAPSGMDRIVAYKPVEPTA